MLAACVSAGIDYVNKLGLDKIRAHAQQLTDRLQKELPPLGYKPLTPHRTRDADRRVRAEGRGRDDEGAAGRTSRRRR